MRIEIGAPHKRADPPPAERSVCRECRDRVCERGEFCPAKEAYDDYDELSKKTYQREFNAVKQISAELPTSSRQRGQSEMGRGKRYDFVLTDIGREFAEKNANLIYRFLHDHKLEEDFYSLIAIGFCRAVAMYNPNKGIFSTFAYISPNGFAKALYCS